MRKADLMELILKTSNDLEVKNNSELFQILMNSYRDLENNKVVKNVVVKLNSSISKYLVTHEYKAPKAIIQLAKTIQYDSNSFWQGTGIGKLFW